MAVLDRPAVDRLPPESLVRINQARERALQSRQENAERIRRLQELSSMTLRQRVKRWWHKGKKA